MKDRSTGYMPRNYTSDRRERHSLLHGSKPAPTASATCRTA